MKILVDKLPASPRDCPFSERNVEFGYVCQLRPYIAEAGVKTRCLCKSVEKCDRLMELGGAGNG